MVGPEHDRSEGEGVARRPGGRPTKSATAFRTISEVADELEVAQHVLRFWESKFPQVRPLKRGGGRRYYRPEDVELLRQIRSLLYEEGYTIRGAQKLLKGQRRPVHESDNGGGAPEGGRRALGGEPAGVIGGRELEGSPELPLEPLELAPEVRERLHDLRAELAALRKVLREVTG
jgi:DNA-binding transcriptional MerR regulator